MQHPSDSTPILSRPHHFEGMGNVFVLGSGEIVLHLTGRGQVFIRRGRADRMTFEGEGTPCHLSADRFVLTNGYGTLVLSGTELEIDLRGGSVDGTLLGTFILTLDGTGEVVTAQGQRLGWGITPRTLQLEGPRVRLTAA